MSQNIVHHDAIVFNFCTYSLSALAWNSLKTNRTWSLDFNMKAHNFSVVIHKDNKVLCTRMWFCIYIVYIGVYQFQSDSSPHWRPRVKGNLVLLADQAIPIFLKFTFSTSGRSSNWTSIYFPFDSCGLASCAKAPRLCRLPHLPYSSTAMHASHTMYFAFGHEPQLGFLCRISICRFENYHNNLRHLVIRPISDSAWYPEHSVHL